MLPETIVSVSASSIPDGLRAARRGLGVKIQNTLEVMRNPSGPDAPGTWRITLEGGITVEVIIKKHSGRNDQPCGIHGPCPPDLLVVNNSIMRGEAWRRVSLPLCRVCSRIDHTPCGNGIWLRVCKRHAIEAGCRSASCRCAPDYASPRLPCGEKVGTNC